MGEKTKVVTVAAMSGEDSKSSRTNIKRLSMGFRKVKS